MRQKGFSPIVIILLIVACLGVVLLGLTAYKSYKNNQSFKTKNGFQINKGKSGEARSFSDIELKNAEIALLRGIQINDPQNDWYIWPEGSTQPDGRSDNSDPYPLGWTDYKSVSVGADDKYIYFKFQFWGIFPEKAYFYNGDLIESTGAKITSFTFTDKNGQSDSADLGAGPWYASFEDKTKPADKPSVGMDAMISPYGKDEYQETLFKINTSEGLIAGGPGKDYILCAFPLTLFNLKLGDTVTFDSSTETGSVKFHHEAMDLLMGATSPGEGGEMKFGAKIKYTLGSDKYEIIENPDYSGHSYCLLTRRWLS